MQKISYNKLLEVACFSTESALMAQEAGADRIEFCSDYAVGGITPAKAEIIKLKELLAIPLHVIIRPRPGNFVYNDDELIEMKESILFCKTHQVNGVVFGALTPNHKVAVDQNKALIDLAENMSTTFHRAIDFCDGIEEAMADLIGLGFKRVLTSGGKANAYAGSKQIKLLQQKFGDKIIIMPGGGVRSSNIAELIEETKCSEYHSAAITNNDSLVDQKEVQKLFNLTKKN